MALLSRCCQIERVVSQLQQGGGWFVDLRHQVSCLVEQFIWTACLSFRCNQCIVGTAGPFDPLPFFRAVKVHATNIADRDSAKLLLGNLNRSFPRLSHLFADHGYTGLLTKWIKEQPHWETEIVPNGNKPSHDE